MRAFESGRKTIQTGDQAYRYCASLWARGVGPSVQSGCYPSPRRRRWGGGRGGAEEEEEEGRTEEETGARESRPLGSGSRTLHSEELRQSPKFVPLCPPPPQGGSVEWSGEHTEASAPRRQRGCAVLGTAGARRHAPLSLRNPARIPRTLRPPPPPRAGVKEHPSPLVTETRNLGAV